MSINGCIRKALSKTGLASLAGLLSLAMTHSVVAAPSQVPLFLTAPVKPVMMLNMSNDHQLFFKAYDDYSDLTDPDGGEPDGNADTTYIHNYDYYGYFDSAKCYTYNNSRFEPAVATDEDKYCGGSHWSGNFLNWATMTRIDAVRKILYGGLRQVDTATETVLERSMLPNDAHSFTKYYNGTDIDKLTPFNSIPVGLADTEATGITICNTTNPANRSQYSQAVTDAPHMLVAKGNYSLWASNERWQCRWGTGSNGNDSDNTGIFAYGSSPSYTNDRLGAGNYNVRVKVCDSTFENNANENCRSYGANQKPAGLLQEFGETGSIAFGLLTGSYGKNKSGGVLRKNIGVMTDEINTNGTFKVPISGNSIIKTLDLLRIYGYNFDSGVYNDDTVNGDNCPWALASFTNGRCSNWGNPQSEIYLESLRYLAGLSTTSSFLPVATKTDASRVPGLNVATWVAPVTNDNYCAPLSVLQFNASTSSYDGDNLGGASSINLSDLNAATNYVGAQEEIHGNEYFVGQSIVSLATPGPNNNQLCTAKEISSLSEVRGTCSDAPRLEGSFQIAGLAHHARSTGIPLTGVTAVTNQTVRTYGVSLAPAVPQISVPVPGSATGHKIIILPACRNTLPNPDANCAIVDFKVIKQDTVTIGAETFNNGILYVNWEDSEQGGDYDQDMWGIIRYTVGASTVVVNTQVMAQSTGDPMGFGYVISGTEDDGFKVHSGVNNFSYAPSCSGVDGNRCTCRNSGSEGVCDSLQSGSRSQTYIVGTSTAKSLEQPLYYAAKWGGYSKELVKEATEEGTPLATKIRDRNPDDTYFFATNPRKLEESLRSAFMGVAAEIGTAASAATNSTRLSDGSRFYQALFDSENWTGTLKTMIRNEAGELVEVTTANTDNEFNVTDSIDSGRKVLTYNEESGALVAFQWDNLTAAQKTQLQDGDTEAVAQKRVAWMRGSRTDESTDGGMRKRKKLLGDIVNSSPVYSGNKAVRYNQLPGAAGTSYPAFTKSKVIYVGANDGMLHAFDAETLQEIFAFIPNAVYPKLADLSRPDYGRGANQHQYNVDGPLYIGDAYIDTNDGEGLKWRTILFGTLGAGGKGVFALDVTDPQAPEFLFELDTTDYPELGYVLGAPSIAPLKNGRWAAIFGNGYESSTSQLFVIDLVAPLDPTYSRVINAQGGTGLSAPSLLPNALSQVESVYAGDLQGNLWKFDLSSTASSDWNRAYGGPMFIAKDSAGNLQPITGGITLGINQVLDGAVMAYFGTGKYFESIDNSAPVAPRHSFYGVADTGASLTYSARSDVLHVKSFTQNADKRTIVGEKTTVAGILTSLVDWTSKKGWYMDFDVVNGERVIVKPTLLSDRLVFNTIIPSSVPCNYGGQSWMMELIAVGDKNLAYSILGENANTQMDSMVTSESTVIMGKDEGLVLNCNVKGDCEYVEAVPPGGFSGRTSWRILR